jgi:hypothetical protein
MEQTLTTFEFYIDTKVTDWYRTPFEIKADTIEEAKELAIKFVKGDHHGEIPWEQIDCTIEPMSVQDNGNQSTEELYYEPENMVSVSIPFWCNTKKD